jgi:hypothetical protein
MDLLSFFDDVTNVVLMPVCAFFACFAIGWIIKPKTAMDEMETGATRLGFLRKIFPVMVRYITPTLILVVEVGGVVSKLQGGHWPVVLGAAVLIALAVLAYFLFFKEADTGTNADELAIEEAAKAKKEG